MWVTGKRSLRRVRGFTLLELLVVVAIMTLVSASIPFAMNRLVPARRVANAADRIVADVRELQARSIATGRPGDFRGDETGYRLTATDSRATRTIALPRSTTLRLIALSDDRPLASLVVYPDGSSSGGRIEIIDAGKRAVVEVSMLSGRVRRVLPNAT